MSTHTINFKFDRMENADTINRHSTPEDGVWFAMPLHGFGPLRVVRHGDLVLVSSLHTYQTWTWEEFWGAVCEDDEDGKAIVIRPKTQGWIGGALRSVPEPEDGGPV